jgi:hypothetical protein
MRAVLCALLVGLFASCGSSSPVGAIRFRTQAPVWRVDDRAPLAAKPKERDPLRYLYKIDSAFARRTTRAMELHDEVHAKDVNALDEVPDSTWFTNRIGIRDLTIDELKRGPNTGPSPLDYRPWTITGSKIGGRSLGFTFEDRLKRKFLLKFDMADLPEAETAAHIIVHRIVWALGYNVPEDYVGYISRGDLVIGDKAREQGLDEARLDKALALVYRRGDGKIRVLASMFVKGTPIGPYAREGRRGDDPNDTIPHEQRRTLRGQYPIFAWVDHTDLKEDNTVDSFDDGFVTHYLVDFGKALGVMAKSDRDMSIGYRFQYDIPPAMLDLVTLGLRSHRWNGLADPGLVGVGLFDLEHFNPGDWKALFPYWPVLDHDRFDAFWGTKLLMRFKPHELKAIVEEAQLSDPRAAEYLVKMLTYRQRATGRYWFQRVAPLDAFAVETTAGDPRLCFTDLSLHYLLTESPTSYAIDVYDRRGKATRFGADVDAGPRGRTCTAIRLADRDPDRYTIVRVRLKRDGVEMPPVVVHVAKLRDGRLEVIGLRRR